jgi:hypothetical protein
MTTYQKHQITVHPSGRITTTELGFVDRTLQDGDMEEERRRFAVLAMKEPSDIIAVEVTDTTVVAVYRSGAVKIVHYWITEEE